MQLNIRQRYKPFTHQFGQTLPLPGTVLSCTIYPTRIVFHDLSKVDAPQVGIIDLSIQGPVKEFTAMLDLEKGLITVFGKDQSGFFRYHIENDVAIVLEKGDIKNTVSGKKPFKKIKKTPPTTRLSLGINKKQDFTAISTRSDTKEILPLLFSLSQWYLALPQQEIKGACLENLEDLIKTGLTTCLAPTNQDNLFQGYPLPPLPNDVAPIQLFPHLYHRILALFADYKKKSLSLRTPFVTGKLGGLTYDTFSIDIEWTKKKMRRIFLYPKETCSLSLNLPKEIKSYRTRKQGSKKPQETTTFEKGSYYLLDRFSK